ncbi:MAG: hypothetical protein WEA61_09120 [Anaerolineales bacterium]
MRKAFASVSLAILILAASLAAAQPAYASAGYCSNGSISLNYEASAMTVSWLGNPRVTGAWLVVPNGIAGKNVSLGVTWAFIPLSGAGTRANPGDSVASHSASGSPSVLAEGRYTHAYVLVRTTLGFCKTPVPNFVIDRLPKQ